MASAIAIGDEVIRHIDGAEHESPEIQKDPVALLTHMDAIRLILHRMLHDVSHHRSDHGGVRRPDAVADLLGHIRRGDEPHGLRILIVVAEVGDAIGILDQTAFERMRLERPAVVQHAVEHRERQIQPRAVPFEPLCDADALLVMLEMAIDLLERLLPDVAKGRVPEVMSERDRLHEVFIQGQCARHRPPDLCDLEGVRHPRPIMIALRRDVDLRLVLHPPEGIAVEDAVTIPRKVRPERILRLRMRPLRLLHMKGARRQDIVFSLFDPFPWIHSRPPWKNDGVFILL